MDGPPRKEDEAQALDALIKLNRCVEAVGNRVFPDLAEHRISPSQFGILDVLYHLGPMCLGQLARKHLRSPNNMTSVVDNMERAGLVRRERSEADRRLIRLHLTDRGRELFEQLWPEHLRRVVDAFSPLSGDERTELAALCRKLGKALSDPHPADGD